MRTVHVVVHPEATHHVDGVRTTAEIIGQMLDVGLRVDPVLREDDTIHHLQLTQLGDVGHLLA